MNSRRWVAVGLATAAVVLLAGRALATLYVEYQWYAAMGASALWRAQTANTLLLRGASAIAGGLFVFANLYAVRHSVVSLVLPRRVANIEIGEEVPGRYLMIAVILLSVLLGGLLTIPQDSWLALGSARYGTLFNETDPYFLLDLGFYVYWLPFETSLYLWSLIALLLVATVVIFLYALTPSLRWERGALRVSTYVRRHLSLLAALLLLILSWSYRLDAYGILSAGSGGEGAFTYVDHKVMIPASLVLAIIAAAAAALVAWAGWRGQVRVALASVTLVLLLSLVLRQLLPVIARRLATQEDPARREWGYVGTRAGFTRRAYAVDEILSGDSTVVFPGRRDAARGVPVWDAAAMARAIARSPRGGDIMSAPSWHGTPAGVVAEFAQRTRDDASDDTGASWRVVRVLATAADARGEIVRVDRVGTPVSDDPSALPAIVFAGARGYRVVADTGGELTAPELETWQSRLAHAWSEQNFRLLFGDLPHPRPRIILHPDVRDRVHALAPFFTQGQVIRAVAVADTIFWTLDLYSASATYPLSRHVPLYGTDWSYFQHAATAVIHAASGRVTIATDLVLDPIARTWTSRFPELFTPRAALPAPILAALSPATEAAVAQAIALARYGPRTPLSAGDGSADTAPWVPKHVARLDDVDSLLVTDGPPVFVLPDGRPAWTLPLIDDLNRVHGLLLATGGLQRASYWLPIVPTTRLSAVRERLQRVPESAAASTRDARVLSAPVRAVVVGGELTYVQPFVTWRTDGAPTLARMAILSGDSLATGRTSRDAWDVPDLAAGPPPAPLTPPVFRARVQALYERMRAALRAGSWTRFGAAYDSLGQLLGRPPR